MKDHPIKSVAEFLFSLLRSEALVPYIHSTLLEISSVSPRETFLTFERLWSRNAALPLGHKSRLCQALTQTVLPACQLGTLAGREDSVRALTDLLMTHAEAEPGPGCETLVALAKVSPQIFSLVSERIFAQFSRADSFSIALQALTALAEACPAEVRENRQLWLTNILACLTGGALTSVEYRVALAVLTVAVLPSDSTQGVTLQDEQLFANIYDSFFNLTKSADSKSIVFYLQALGSLSCQMTEVMLQPTSVTLAECVFLSLKQSTRNPSSPEDSVTLVALFSAIDSLVLCGKVFAKDPKITDSLLTVLARFEKPDPKNPAYQILIRAIRRCALFNGLAAILKMKLEKRATDQTAGLLWILVDAERHSPGFILTSYLTPGIDTAVERSRSIREVGDALVDIASVLKLSDVSDALLDYCLDRATAESEFELPLSVVLGLVDGDVTRLSKKVVGRLVSFPTDGVWQLCSILTACSAKGLYRIKKADYAWLFIWLQGALVAKAHPVAAEQRCIAEALVAISAGQNPGLSERSLEGDRRSQGSPDSELSLFFDAFRDAPDELHFFVSCCYDTLTNFNDLLKYPIGYRLPLLRMFGATLAFCAREDSVFEAFARLIDCPEFLSDPLARLEAGRVFGQAAVRFPARMTEFLQTSSNTAIANSTSTSSVVLSIFKPSAGLQNLWLRAALAVGWVSAVAETADKSFTLKQTVETLLATSDGEIASAVAWALAETEARVTERRIAIDFYDIQSIIKLLLPMLLPPVQDSMLQPRILHAISSLVRLAYGQALEIAVIAAILDSVLKLLVLSIPECGSITSSDILNKFDGANSVVIAIFMHANASWLAAIRLMQAIQTVGLSGSLSPVRLLTMRMANEICKECGAVRDLEQESLWAGCVSIIIPRLFDTDLVTRTEAILSVNHLLERFEATRELKVNADASNAKTVLSQVFQAINQETVFVMAGELATTIRDKNNLGGLTCLIDLLNKRAAELSAEAASTIASALMSSGKDASLVTSAERGIVSCLRPLLASHFSRVFEEIFLGELISKRSPIYTFALKEVSQERQFLVQIMSQTTDILNNAAIADPQLEALEVLQTVLNTDDLEVGAVARCHFAQLCTTFAFVTDARLSETSAACVTFAAKHSLVTVKPSLLTEPDGVYECIRGLILERPDSAAEFLTASLNYSTDRPYQTIQALLAIRECSHDAVVVEDACKWLLNFDMVRNNPQMIRRVRETAIKV